MNNTIEKNRVLSQHGVFNAFAHRVNRLGMNMAVCDAEGKVVFQADAGQFDPDMKSLLENVRQAFDNPFSGIRASGEQSRYYLSLIRHSGAVAGAAVLDRGLIRQRLNDGIEDYCKRNKLDEQELFSLLSGNTQADNFSVQTLESFVAQLESSPVQNGQIDKLTTELSQTYEQIILLYNLSTHMKVTQSNAEFLQYACDQLTELVSVEGLAIYLEKNIEGQKRLTLTAGCGYVSIDPTIADILQVHLAAELCDGKEALLDSNVYGPFKYSWPQNIKQILAVPLQGGDKMIGLMVATNCLNKPDFDSTDIKLFNSVANQCAVFIENGRLFADLKELFIGSLKALSSSIDAKDQYTRGHSERVAFISRWIVEQMVQTENLPADLIHHVYLSGLLHDIGKIGVAEAVLRKQGKLTDEERKVICSHPRTGAAILSEIPQMRSIVPGVLHHHERYDGKGYPQGLAGTDIPLLGRIISLADAFDAMTSKRVYRDAMSLKRALAEIEKGCGSQFDPDIVRVFLTSDIDKLWQIIQDGFIETWDYSNFSEYGTLAVGALMK